MVLLVSALLTAGYLLPISINGFFPGHAHGEAAVELSGCEVGWRMLVPLIVLAALTLILGLCPSLVEGAIASISASVL